MIEAVTRYRVHGIEFKTEADARQYAEFRAGLDMALAILAPLEDSDAFDRGEGYIQRTAGDLLTFRQYVYQLALTGAPKTAHMWAEDPRGIVGRYWDDGDGPFSDGLSRCYARHQCVDDNLRQWGQPYYVHHPEARIEVELGRTP